MDPLEVPDYALLKKVLNTEDCDTSMVVSKSKSIPVFSVKREVMRTKF